MLFFFFKLSINNYQQSLQIASCQSQQNISYPLAYIISLLYVKLSTFSVFIAGRNDHFKSSDFQIVFRGASEVLFRRKLMKEQYHIEGVPELIHPEHHHFLFITFFEIILNIQEYYKHSTKNYCVCLTQILTFCHNCFIILSYPFSLLFSSSFSLYTVYIF